ncbi:MAG TPA: lectin-like protein [Candidatus Acidoferrum sp.]|nr:lectin-like protein [Candidatus Acidoferrum sp.]
MSRRSFLCLFILVLTTSDTRLFASVLTGPITNSGNGHVYFLLSSNNWTTAEVEARQLGGHLATVRNATEENWIYSTFSHWAGTNRNLWIGLYDPDPAVNSSDRATRRTEFQWISGEPVAYSNWSPVEPNNTLSSDTSYPELYVHIWNPTDTYGGTWNNYTNYSSVFGIQNNGVAEVVPPVNPLNIRQTGANAVDLYWKTESAKTYQLLFSPVLPAPAPTNLVQAVGSDNTKSLMPATTTLLNRGWTNLGAAVTGNGTTNHTSDVLDRPQKFYQVISYP